MKIKCIDNFGQEGALTVGKIYIATIYDEAENDDYYLILKTNEKDSGGYLKDRFIEVTIRDERKEKLKKLNEKM